jgi:segregation and condensation protein A
VSVAQRTKIKPELKIVVSNSPEAPAVEPPPEQVEMPFAIVNGEPVTQMPKDLYIPPQAMEVFLEAFEGPLDLLLYLIRRQNLNILDIPLAEITRQYMKYIEVMTELQLELAGEYMVMAATLAEIKSRMLLPRPKVDPDGNDEDPRAELVRRLQEYERFKRAAEGIDALPRLERDVWTTSAELKDRKVVRLLPLVTLQEMLLAFKDVVVRSEMFAHHHIQRERLSVRARMGDILSTLELSSFVEFARLFRFEEGRMGVTVTFVAILELVREGLIEIVQAEPFAPIHVRSAGAARKLHVVAGNEALGVEFADESAAGGPALLAADAAVVAPLVVATDAELAGLTESVIDPDFVDDDEDLEDAPLEGVDDVVDETAAVGVQVEPAAGEERALLGGEALSSDGAAENDAVALAAGEQDAVDTPGIAVEALRADDGDAVVESPAGAEATLVADDSPMVDHAAVGELALAEELAPGTADLPGVTAAEAQLVDDGAVVESLVVDQAAVVQVDSAALGEAPVADEQQLGMADLPGVTAEAHLVDDGAVVVESPAVDQAAVAHADSAAMGEAPLAAEQQPAVDAMGVAVELPAMVESAAVVDAPASEEGAVAVDALVVDETGVTADLSPADEIAVTFEPSLAYVTAAAGVPSDTDEFGQAVEPAPSEEVEVTVDPTVFAGPTATIEPVPSDDVPLDEPAPFDAEYAGPAEEAASAEQALPDESDDVVSLIGDTSVAGDVSLIGDESVSGGPAVEVEEFAFDELPALDEVGRADQQPAAGAQTIVKEFAGTDEPPSPGEESDE